MRDPRLTEGEAAALAAASQRQRLYDVLEHALNALEDAELWSDLKLAEARALLPKDQRVRRKDQ